MIVFVSAVRAMLSSHPPNQASDLDDLDAIILFNVIAYVPRARHDVEPARVCEDHS